MKRLYIMRGLPGSSKSTTIQKIININITQRNISSYAICSADDYFKCGNQYLWYKEDLYKAHNRCRDLCLRAMHKDIELIFIDNTNIKKSDYMNYLNYAEIYNYEVEIIDLFDGGLSDEELFKRNTHNVPLETIRSMRAKYQR